MTTPWIDPQSPEFRAQFVKESWSMRTAFMQLVSSSCSNVPKSEMYKGGDVSQWQGTMDWNKYFDNGMNYTVIRAMINGRADTQYDKNVRTLTDQKRKFLVYGATGWPTVSNCLPYARALADLIKGVPYLAIWLDSETSGNLTPYQMSVWNSNFLGELSVLLPGSILEIYTRQSFWDSNVQAGNWNKYPLAAARYYEQLTCPWSDGRFIFRDWDDWRYWQISECWDGYAHGAESRCIDGDLFNGDEKMFNEVYNVTEPPPPSTDCCKENRTLIDSLYVTVSTLSDRVDELENTSHIHETEPPPTDKDYVNVQIREQHKSHYYKNSDTTGKPIMLTDDTKPALEVGQVFMCQKNLAISSMDNPNTPTTIASGGQLFFRIIEEGAYKGRFIRKDKSMQVA